MVVEGDDNESSVSLVKKYLQSQKLSPLGGYSRWNNYQTVHTMQESLCRVMWIDTADSQFIMLESLKSIIFVDLLNNCIKREPGIFRAVEKNSTTVETTE